MAIYDDVVNGLGWMDPAARVVPDGRLQRMYQRSTCDTTEFLFRHGSPGTLYTATARMTARLCRKTRGATMETIQAKLGMVRQSNATTGKAKQNQAGVAHPRHPNTNRGIAAHRLSDCRYCTALLRLNFQNLPSPSNKPTINATPHPIQRQLTLPSHSPKPPCPLYALMLIDDTRVVTAARMGAPCGSRGLDSSDH